MSGWQWFWTLVGFIIYIVVLVFLYFYQPFEDLFNLVINGLIYENATLWAVVIVGIAGFCGYHWRASTFIAIVLSAGAALQSVQILCVYLLEPGYTLDGDFGVRLAAVVALVILTGIFCVIFWFLKVMRPVRRRGQA